MDIPGVDSMLNRSVTGVWPTENAPAEAAIDLFQAAESAVSRRAIDTAVDLIDHIDHLSLQPSQAMRLHYLRGKLYRAIGSYDQAHDSFVASLALACEFGDHDSSILLTWHAGQMRYSGMRFADAQGYFQDALCAWRDRAARLSSPAVEPTARFNADIALQQCLLGDFEGAQASLARALTLSLYTSPRQSPYQRKTAAAALWTLMLTFRAQSDMRDGDVRLLRSAISRAQAAFAFYRSAEASTLAKARFRIQVAGVYLDLAETLVAGGATDTARRMRRTGHTLATEAAGLLGSTDYAPPKLLAELTLLRHDIMRHGAREAATNIQSIERRIIRVERAAADIENDVIVARAAVVRAEWLLSLGDVEHAREALTWALRGFHSSGMGMATRALRLMRAINSGMPPYAPARHHPVSRRP